MEQLAYIGFSNLLIKSDEKDDTIIYLEASNEGLDADSEIVMMKALKDEADNFLKKGLISWDHQHKAEKNPKFIIGEPLDVKFTDDNRTLVKAQMYKEKEYAQEVMKMAKSNTTRLGASIGGNIVSKSKVFNKERHQLIPVINKIQWDEVAVTYKPVNGETLGKCGYYDFGAFAKALMAGGGVNAGNFTGGRALIGEVTQKNLSDVRFWKDIITGIVGKKIVQYTDLQTYLNSLGISEDGDVQAIASIVADNMDKIRLSIK